MSQVEHGKYDYRGITNSSLDVLGWSHSRQMLSMSSLLMVHVSVTAGLGRASFPRTAPSTCGWAGHPLLGKPFSSP